MVIGFEDAFIEVLADYVSLCLELMNNDVDVIYGFLYQSPGMRTHNAFFRKNGCVQHFDEIGLSDEIVDRFFDVGFQDIERLLAVCKQYEHPCPHEIRLTYDVVSRQFDAKYGYDDYVEGSKSIDPNKVFDKWMDEEIAKASH